MNPFKTQTNFLYTETLAKGRLNVLTALGHMLMPLAQRWADNQCCRCIPLCPDYKTPISSDCFDLVVQNVGICGVKFSILLTCFVYMAIYDSPTDLHKPYIISEQKHSMKVSCNYFSPDK